MSELIRIKQLSKDFAGFKALDELDLVMEKQQIFGLLGLNGAGKSTTMRCLLTIIKPTSGEIYFEGRELHTNRKAILRRIGAMVERADHYLFLTAYQNVVVQARLYGLQPDKKSIDKLLHIVGLDGHIHQKVKNFSQGMKQRLGIACALVHDPNLIILDEPANGLDPQGIIDLRNLILSLKNDMNKSVMLSSHLLSEIEQVADSLAIIHHGKNMIQGSVNELLTDEEMIVMITTESGHTLANALSNTRFANMVQNISAHKLIIKISKTGIPALNAAAIATGLPIYAIENKKKLEDYFFKLTHDE